jgi:uncharacterized membrane protein
LLIFYREVSVKKIINYLRKDMGKIRDFYFHANSASLQRRRSIVAISILGLANASFMTLYQTGIMKRLPDLPARFFDANKVTSSKKAFEFGMPDAPGASLLYSLIMTLATYGGNRRLKRHYSIDLLLLAAVVINASFAVQYFINMLVKQKKICLYCVAATLTNISMLPYAWTEFKEARRERLA